MNLTLFLLLALTASWTGLVQCEDEEEKEAELADREPFLLVTTKAAEEDDPENHGDVTGSGHGSSQTIESSLELGSTPNNGSNLSSDDETKLITETDTEANPDTEELNIVIMIIIPLVLTLVIISMIVCLVLIYRRLTIRTHDTKEDPYLDGDDHEKVPMPMFEDDIPSVMELEMEDLENWMAKDGGKKVDTGQI